MQSAQNVAKSFIEETVTDCSLYSAQEPQNQLRAGVGGLGRPTRLAEEPGVPWKDTKAVATSPGSNLNPSPRRWALESITVAENSHLMLACSSAEIEERAPGKASLTSSSGAAEPLRHHAAPRRTSLASFLSPSYSGPRYGSPEGPIRAPPVGAGSSPRARASWQHPGRPFAGSSAGSSRSGSLWKKRRRKRRARCSAE